MCDNFERVLKPTAAFLLLRSSLTNIVVAVIDFSRFENPSKNYRVVVVVEVAGTDYGLKNLCRENLNFWLTTYEEDIKHNIISGVLDFSCAK